MSPNRTTLHGLQVDTRLVRFIDDEALPGTGIDQAAFWAGFGAIVAELAPKNAALLAERDRLQSELDAWHRKNPGPISDAPAGTPFWLGLSSLGPLPQVGQVRADGG